MVLSSLEGGRLYASRAGSFVHVSRGVVCTRLLSFILSDAIDQMLSKEAKLQCHFSVARCNTW